MAFITSCGRTDSGLRHQKPGYAGKILRVDLSTGRILTAPTEIYAGRFLGGRGLAAKIHWDEAPPEVGAPEPENLLTVTTGPICGVPGFAGSRWQISGKSPQQNTFSYGNLGGAWGAQLKFAGYDGLVVQGRADKLTCLVIDQDKVELREASDLKGKGAIAVREALKEQLGRSFRVLAVGPAGENLVSFATVLADSDSSGAGGLGAVMGIKNLKAVVVRGRNKIEVADPGRAAQLRKKLRELKFEAFPPPTHILPRERLKKEVCFGCIDGCIRRTYTSLDGRTGKYMCQSRFFYETRARRYYGQPSEVSFLATKLCDDHGLDATVMETMIMWLSRCHKAGLLNETETGLPLSKLGSLEFIETLVHKISYREGFGGLLAEGTFKAAQSLGRGAEDFITDYMTKTGESAIYGPRVYLTTGLLYALEPRQPIQQLHEISAPALLWAARQTGLEDNFMTSEVIRKIAHRFWGSEIAADFSTYEGKALAAAKIQDRQYAKECLILCDLSWPVLFSPETPDHVGDPSLESQVCSAVTGRDIDEPGLYKIGERVFNLQRAIIIRERGAGRAADSLEKFNFNLPLKSEAFNPDCLVPGPDGQPFSRKGLTFDPVEFEKMKDEYYALRGWDVPTGLPTRAKLNELGLDDIAPVLAGCGLLA